MSTFDFIVLGILLVSGILGYLQGALNSLAALAALVAALALAMLGFRYLAPILDARVNPDWITAPLAFLLLFGGGYLAFRLIGAGLSGGIRQARFLNALDRAFGFALGLVRATLFLGVCNLAFTVATPRGFTPGWLEGSLFLPLTARSADLIRFVAPRGLEFAGQVAPQLGQTAGEPAEERHEGDTKAHRRYDTDHPRDPGKSAETPW